MKSKKEESTVGLLSEAECKRLEDLFESGWNKVPAADEHWIRGVTEDYNEAESYCYECAEQRIEQLEKENPEGEWLIGGGWGSESDSTPYCAACEQLLDSTLTPYGCESEVDHFIMYGFDPQSNGDCRAMYEVILSGGWHPDRYADRLHRLGRAILSQLDTPSQQ